MTSKAKRNESQKEKKVAKNQKQKYDFSILRDRAQHSTTIGQEGKIILQAT